MQIGMLLIIFAFLATLYSTWQYYLISRDLTLSNSGQHKYFESYADQLKFARIGYYMMFFLVSIATVYLLNLILTHQFQISYVYRYTSQNLPLGYLVSALWAGQEGSFLLWAFLTAVMGVVVIKTSREFEPHVMLVLNIIQGFFLLILIKASPFELLPQTPIDGAGLNPLLQNPWMVIHPPVLFIGYAAISIPYAFAVAALIRREYQQFVSYTLPWVLFASLTLGAGIIIGGYWAYKVLGWGGYWGWDPVENSSLIPWLTTLGLAHGLIVQRKQKKLIKTNLFLAIVSFALVIYATFLTRSGVLADFSVHSFQDLGINLYLIAFILSILGGGLGMFLRRYREINAAPISTSELNREMILLASLFVFVTSAFLTFLGTSSPIVTALMGKPAQVDISFYNKVHLPIGVMLAILLGIAPFLLWKRNAAENLLHTLSPSLILTVLTVVIPIYLGMHNPLMIIFTASAAFALWSNTIMTARLAKINWQITGAPITHLGVALLLGGIVISAEFERNQWVELKEGIPATALNYKLTYKGITPVANSKDIVNIDVSSANTTYKAQPRYYFSQYNNAAMREPDVQVNLLYDVYISPLERRQVSESKPDVASLWIKKGEKKQVRDLAVFFREFDLADHEENEFLKVGAHIEVDDGVEKYSLSPAIIFEQNEKRSKAAAFPVKNAENDSVRVILNALNADEKSIELYFSGADASQIIPASNNERILVDISEKPFMSVLWVGTILIIIGTAIALYHRLPETVKSFKPREEGHHVAESMSELPG